MPTTHQSPIRNRASEPTRVDALTAVALAGLTAAAWLAYRSTAGLWGALPYFAAVDTILKEDLTIPQSVAALAYYNVIFVSSGVALVIIRAVMGEKADAVFETVNRLVALWGKRLVIATMVILGVVMLADGVGWLLGRPLIPVATIVMLFLLAVGMLAGGRLKFQLFPELDGDFLVAQVELPAGTDLELTKQIVLRIEEALVGVNAEFKPDQPEQQDLIRTVSTSYGFVRTLGDQPGKPESGRNLAKVPTVSNVTRRPAAKINTTM